MNQSKNTINMTEGPILKNIILFTFPLLVSNILQLLYNAADLIVVSNYAGSYAMGSVGATGSIIAILINTVIGMSIGSTVIVAKYFGAADKNGILKAVQTSLGLAMILSVIMTVFAEITVIPVLKLMGTPKELFNGAVLYSRIIYMGIPAQLVYNFCAAVLRGMGDTRRPMYILAGTGIVNVVLNLIFVIGFGMDVDGVAIATIVSQYLSAIFVIVCLTKNNMNFNLLTGKIRIYKNELKEIMKVGIPCAISSCLMNLSNAVVVSGVNSFGAHATSGYAAACSIDNIVFMGMNALSQATLTSVSQNYGAKNPKRMFKCMRRCLYLSAAVGGILGILVVIFSKPLLGIYIKDSAEAIEFANIKNVYTASICFICGIMAVLANAARGLGYSTTTTINEIWCLVGTRLLWIYLILPLRHTPEVLFMCWGASWILSTVVHAITILIVKKKAIQKMYAQ